MALAMLVTMTMTTMAASILRITAARWPTPARPIGMATVWAMPVTTRTVTVRWIVPTTAARYAILYRRTKISMASVTPVTPIAMVMVLATIGITAQATGTHSRKTQPKWR